MKCRAGVDPGVEVRVGLRREDSGDAEGRVRWRKRLEPGSDRTRRIGGRRGGGGRG